LIPTLKSIFNILTLLLGLLVSGQTEKPKEEKEKIDWKPYELKMAVNLVRSGRTLLGSGIKTHEIQAALAMDQYNLVLDFGTEENNRSNGYQYQSKGNYYRIGIDNNFVKDKSSGNAISLGLRYAQANFEETLNYTNDYGFGSQSVSESNPNVIARWAELNFNIRGKIATNLYMGMTLRWQMLRRMEGEGDFKTYDIPGFGNTKRDNSTQFDYYLAWRIPFGKDSE
jgi:hypothetical protein